MTPEYLLFRAAERFGQNPFELSRATDETEQRRLVWYEVLRMAEDDRRLSMTIGGIA